MHKPEIPRATSPALIDALRARFGERLSTSPAIREHHGKDESAFPIAPPDAVVFPETTDECVQIVKLCAAHDANIIPYGVGTSLEGHVLAVHGGVCVDMSRMNNILAVNVDDLDCTVQAGVTRKQLNLHLQHTGLFFPIDPGADATLAGMASTRASGTNAVRYGTMRENVLGLTIVLADGRIIKTGGRSRKSAAGYDLTRLFVGAEGTLGLITEVTLRLYPQPEAASAAICAFPTIDAAVRTVIQTIQLGVPVARCELLDSVTIKAVNLHSKLGLRESPMLFCEFHGSVASVEEQAQTVQAIAKEQGGMDFEWSTKQEDRTRLWQARHDAYPACLRLKPGGRAMSTDVCVPISKLAECVAQTNADLKGTTIPIALFGHVGDGNFHLAIVVDPNNPHDLEEAERVNHNVVARALSMGGTCTGEHGIGYGKLDFLDAEHGNAVPVMHAIKHALDPRNLFNRGKVVRYAG
ncbi:MAG: FAD-binding protein [Betaproteobacteria bacterium]|nr:FAD-binding protein [Betaproteobacteria bacterium]